MALYGLVAFSDAVALFVIGFLYYRTLTETYNCNGFRQARKRIRENRLACLWDVSRDCVRRFSWELTFQPCNGPPLCSFIESSTGQSHTL